MRTHLRAGPLSVPVNPRPLLAGAAVAAATALVFALALTLGDFPLTVPDVVRVLAGGGTRIERRIVVDVRLGRAVAAVCVGMALAFAGALTQTVARNPLASPDVLGITQGASLAAVAAIAFTGGAVGPLGLPAVAVLGALAAAVGVWLLAGDARGSVLRLVLIGVGASMFLGACTTWIMSATSLDRAESARLWLTGSLNGRDLSEAWPVVVAVTAALLLSGWLAFQLSALALGEATAHVLGHDVRLAQAAQLLVAVVLSAVAVSAAGPVGFVAFVTPQIAMRLGGTPTPPLVLSALTGGLLLSLADLVARAALPWELPVGVVTAFFGAPVLLYLIVRINRRSS